MTADELEEIRKRCDYGEPDASDVEKLLVRIAELEAKLVDVRRARDGYLALVQQHQTEQPGDEPPWLFNCGPCGASGSQAEKPDVCPVCFEPFETDP